MGRVVFYRAGGGDRDGLIAGGVGAAGGRGPAEQIEEIRERIVELNGLLEVEEDRLSRLVITRETVEEILGEAARLVGEPTARTTPRSAPPTAPPSWPPCATSPSRS